MKLRLFCHHKWVRNGSPYLAEMGMTKRCSVKCAKCGKVSDVDIFNARWFGYAEKDEKRSRV